MTPLRPASDRGRVAPWLLLATACFVAAALVGDRAHVAAGMTYGNFDVPSERSGIETMAPGVPDLARERVYRFGEGAQVHATPLVALGIVFAVFLLLRTWGHRENRMGIRRGFVQWVSFVLARVGVLRAANAYPVARCTFGVFPFLNCQYCEMASGACPVGVVQRSVADGRVPFLAVGVVTAVGATLGRWICGWFCPFGLFLDLCERGGKRGPVTIPRAWRLGKFAVLGLLVAGAAALALAGVDGISWFCATICPAGSVYGLIPYYGTTAAAPAADALLRFDPGVGGHWLVWGHLLFFAGFLVVTFRVAARFFCSAACPLGAALGLFARVALVRVVHVDEHCTGCGACVKVCPTGIDLAHGDFLTVSDCIQCTRCVRVCATGGRDWSFRVAARAKAAAAERTERAPV